MLLIYSLVTKIRNGNRQHTMIGDDARVENVDSTFVEHQKPALISRPSVASSNVWERHSIVTESAERNGPPPTSWSAVPGYFIECFALCGASVPPNAVFPTEAFRVDRNMPPQLGRVSPSFVSEAVDAYARWLCKACWNLIATPWAHWRRERLIKKAVVALEGFDDLTLRQMGICHRSQIEQTVRYCRDC